MTAIDIDLEDPEALALWRSLGELAGQLPGEWLLIGGLMVQLHAIEHGQAQVRATRDIDILGQARPQWTLTALHEKLTSLGFALVGPDLDGYAHRYRSNDGAIVDVLSPDGIKPPAEDRRPQRRTGTRRQSGTGARRDRDRHHRRCEVPAAPSHATRRDLDQGPLG